MLKKINVFSYIIMIISFILLTIGIVKLGMVPNKYLVIYFVILGVVSLILGLCSFLIKNKVVSVFLIVITLIISCSCFFIFGKVNQTEKFLANINSKVQETSLYYVVVLKDSNINGINDLASKRIGTNTTDSKNYDKSISILNKSIKYDNIKYTNVLSLSKDLLEEKVDAIYISSNIKDMLDEEYDGFSDKTKVIEEFKINVDSSSSNKTVKSSDTFSIYISGIDTYGSISRVSRSDVNIIMTVNPRENKILLTTIPRDSYVRLHGTTGSKDKLTHAGIYGINMSKSTIEDFLDIDIDYYVRVNFDSLIKIIDTIGGVNVNSDIAFTAQGYNFVVGYNKMDGKKALAFSRARKQFAGGDRLRGQHQQAVITAILEKVISSRVLLGNYAEILNGLSAAFQSDIPDSLIRNFVKGQLDDMKSWDIKSISVDGNGTYTTSTYSMPGWNLYVMIPDDATVKNAHNLIVGME